LSISAFLACALAQDVQYTLEFPNATHHEAEIEVRFEGAPPRLQVRMSRSSPGRYATHEFARNVYNVRVTDGAGRTLQFTRPNAHQWDVSGHDGTVVVRYTLFGDAANGTYASINASGALLNMPGTLLWARELQSRPAALTIRPPTGRNWKVATQLEPISELKFRAPHLQYLLDSPLLIGDITFQEWTAGQAKMRIGFSHNGTPAEGAALARILEAAVSESEGVFGELPAFDFGTYTFMVDIRQGLAVDGMEHRNSTMVNLSQSIKDMRAVPAVLPHEFFHAWNVERIRPQSLEPFQFEDTNISEELWFAEGFTSYYSLLILRRAGLTSLDRMLAGMTSYLNAVLSSPVSGTGSAVEMSQYAPFADRGAGGGTITYVPSNLRNMFVSYYSYGAALALGIDLAIRSEYPSKSADDWMRAMWVQFGRSQRDYRPVKAYTLDNLEKTLASVTSNEFAARIFNQHIRGKEPMLYEALLAKAGLLLRPVRPAAASLGHTAFTFSDAGAVLSAGTLRGTPLYLAGLDNGDRIVQIDGKDLKTQRDLDEWLKTKKPNDRITAKVTTSTGTRDVEVVLAGDPALEIVPLERAKRNVSKQQLALRDGWLASKAARPLPVLHRFCGQCRRAHPFEFETCPYDGKPLGFVQP
jgi:predicted metalloprotease with PDZ domain